MRSRQEIEAQIKDSIHSSGVSESNLQLVEIELLLDIRDLIQQRINRLL